MAMSAGNTRKKHSSLKGAVLYTVLAVMMVVMILMLTTIALAGAAAKRAYSEYADTQVVSSAQSFTDSLLESLKRSSTGNPQTNADLGDAIFADMRAKQSANDTTPYVVTVSSGGDLGHGMGTVTRVEFSYAGTDNLSGYYVKGSDIMIVKVTTFVQMGDEETSYTEYLTDLISNPPGSGGGTGGLLSAGPTNLSGTSISVLGPFGGGLGSDAMVGGELELKNNGVFTGSQTFNHGINFNVAKLLVYGTNKAVGGYTEDGLAGGDYQGFSVLGDMKFSSSGVSFISKYDQNDDRKVPYVFVSGTIDYGSSSVAIGTFEKGRLAGGHIPNSDCVEADMIGNKVNIYCGTFLCPSEPKELSAVGDLYCYDSSGVSLLRGQNNRSNLIDWATYVTKARDSWRTGAAEPDTLNMWKGNVFTKGGLKFGSSDFTIDGNVYVDKDLDLTDITRDNPGVPDVTGTISVRGNVLLPAVPPDNGDKKTRYDALIAKITTVTDNGFPADKELDKILGIDYTNSPSTGRQQLEAVESGEYTISDTTDVSKKIVVNTKEQQLKYYDFSPRKAIKHSESASGVTPGSPVITPGSIASGSTIGYACTFTSTGSRFQNTTIYIDPNQSTLTDAEGNKVLWIDFDDVNFDGNCKIIVEDRKKDVSGNFIFKKDQNGNDTTEYEKVYVKIFVKPGTELKFGNSDMLMTQYYYDNYFHGGVKLEEDLEVKTSDLDRNLIPGIYVYSSNDEATYGHSDSKIKISNNAMVTAYFVAPTSEFDVSDGGVQANANVIYEDAVYSGLKLGIIGSAIVGSVAPAQGNDFTLVYIPNDGGQGVARPPLTSFAFNKIPGYSTY